MNKITSELSQLLAEIKKCRVCEAHLPNGCRPVVSAASSAKILIVGQAPGIRVHNTGIPWNDPSGNRLRTWMDVDKKTFYDNSKIAIVPMGFCYPGTAKRGDLPPRKECGPLWHPPLLKLLPNIKLTLLFGMYAQKYYLGKRRKKNLTLTVQNFEEYAPDFLPLVHPSPRNYHWVNKNPWFEETVIPYLRKRTKALILNH